MGKPHFKNDAGKFLTFKCQLSFRERIVWANSNKCLLMLFSKCPNDFFLFDLFSTHRRICRISISTLMKVLTYVPDVVVAGHRKPSPYVLIGANSKSGLDLHMGHWFCLIFELRHQMIKFQRSPEVIGNASCIWLPLKIWIKWM